jgi:CII-binding regulator of phage lambda lysogenization HflD
MASDKEQPKGSVPPVDDVDKDDSEPIVEDSNVEKKEEKEDKETKPTKEIKEVKESIKSKSKLAATKHSKKSQQDEIDAGVTTMSEDDVSSELKKLAKVDPKVLNDIYNTHAQLINAIVAMVKKQLKDEEDIVEIEHLQRVLNLAPLDEKFIRTKDKIWAVREHLIKKNAKFFLDRDYSKQIKKDHNQVMMETLVNLVKIQFNSLSAEDQDFYWQKGNMLLVNVCKYYKLLETADEPGTTVHPKKASKSKIKTK